MTEENTTPTPSTPPTSPDNEDIDTEVNDLLTDMLALLCNTDISHIKLQSICGDKSTMFVADFVADDQTKSLHRGAVIGRGGRTIKAIQQYLRAVGGVYRHYYDFDLVEDPNRPRRSRR